MAPQHLETKHMAKRFTDTNKYKKPFIRGLKGAYKLLWDYLYHDCDHAGIWIVDFEIAQLYIGSDMQISKPEALKYFNSDEIRIIEVDNGSRWFIPSFIDFQYGTLNEFNRAHKSIISILNKYELYKHKPLTSPLQGRKDMDMDMDKEMDKEKEEKGSFKTFENTELHFLLLDYFGFSEMRNPDKLQQITTFLNILFTDGKTEQFREQFEAYKLYKEKSATAKHSFPRFLGTIEERYIDGGWNQENWVNKLHSVMQVSTPIETGETLAQHNRRVRASLNL